MFATATMTMRGNVVAEPYITGSADHPDRVTFRVISNQRRKNQETGEWVQSGEYGMNVVCWRKLARGAAQVIHKGDPVLVTGRVSERRYQASDGEQRWHTELTADFIGHDLSQGYAGRFTRFTKLDRLHELAGDGGAAGVDSAPAGDVTPSGSEGAGYDADHDSGYDVPAGTADDFDAGQANEVFGEPQGELVTS